MRPEIAHADRTQAVRDAARDWLREGWIDETAWLSVGEAYPDDRVRAGLTFRILFFVLALCALQGAMGVLYMLAGSAVGNGVLAFFAGSVCAGITDYLTGPLKRRQGGIEAAFSAFAVAQLMIAIGLFLQSVLRSPFEKHLALLLFSRLFLV